MSLPPAQAAHVHGSPSPPYVAAGGGRTAPPVGQVAGQRPPGDAGASVRNGGPQHLEPGARAAAHRPQAGLGGMPLTERTSAQSRATPAREVEGMRPLDRWLKKAAADLTMQSRHTDLHARCKITWPSSKLHAAQMVGRHDSRSVDAAMQTLHGLLKNAQSKEGTQALERKVHPAPDARLPQLSEKHAAADQVEPIEANAEGLAPAECAPDEADGGNEGITGSARRPAGEGHGPIGVEGETDADQPLPASDHQEAAGGEPELTSTAVPVSVPGEHETGETTTTTDASTGATAITTTSTDTAATDHTDGTDSTDNPASANSARGDSEPGDIDPRFAMTVGYALAMRLGSDGSEVTGNMAFDLVKDIVNKSQMNGTAVSPNHLRMLIGGLSAVWPRGIKSFVAIEWMKDVASRQGGLTACDAAVAQGLGLGAGTRGFPHAELALQEIRALGDSENAQEFMRNVRGAREFSAPWLSATAEAAPTLLGVALREGTEVSRGWSASTFLGLNRQEQARLDTVMIFNNLSRHTVEHTFGARGYGRLKNNALEPPAGKLGTGPQGGPEAEGDDDGDDLGRRGQPAAVDPAVPRDDASKGAPAHHHAPVKAADARKAVAKPVGEQPQAPGAQGEDPSLGPHEVQI